MKYLLPSLLAVALLAACGQQPATPATDTAANTPVAPVAAPAAAPAPACAKAKGYDLLPAGVCMTEKYGFREDKPYTDKQGRGRHRLTFGYFGRDADTVAKNVGAAFKAAGYNVRPATPAADGTLTVPMTNKTTGTTYLVARQSPKLRPDGKVQGTFSIDFATAPAAEQTASTP
jgi:hypothetical protein